MTLRLESVPVCDYASIDESLKRSFEVVMAAAPVEPGDDAAQAAMRAFAWRALHLATALLRAIRVPAIAGCRVLAVTAIEKSKFTVSAVLPRVDGIGDKLYVRAADQAVQLMRRMIASTDRGPAFTATLQDSLHSGFVKPLQVGGGESTMPLLTAAAQLGIPFRHVSKGTFQLGWGSAARLFERGAIQFDSAIGARMAQDKWVAAQRMRDAGLPSPAHVLVSSLEDARSAAIELGWPVVVKPVDRDRGEGVTVDVIDEQILATAFQHAASFSRRVLVERQVSGTCHRVVVAGDQVLLVSKRMAKSVRGDGVRSVEQLVLHANQTEQLAAPWSRLKPFPLDDLALQSLASVGLSREAVPAQGQFVPLRRIQSSEFGGVVEHLTDVIHPDNAAISIKAARLFGLSIAGIDIISDDISRPWHENGAMLNEVNYSSLLPNRQSAHVLPGLLRKFIAADGRIPVEAVIGGDEALTTGEQIRAGYAARGLRCHLVTHDCAISAGGERVVLAAQGLFSRALAMLFDSQVDALVMVIQSDELLRTGLPVDRITQVTQTQDAKQMPWLAPMRELLAHYRCDSI